MFRIYIIFIIIILVIAIFIYISHREYKKNILELNKLIRGDYSKSRDYCFISPYNRNLNKHITTLRLTLQASKIARNKNNKKLKLKYIQNSQFISSLSHEFKNPISIILGYCDLLDDAKTKDLAKQKIQNQAKKMDMILNRLYLAIRLENELIKLEISRFNLNDIILEICNNLENKYNRTISLKLDSLEINADKILLETAISNLIENALKYSKNNVKIILKKNELKIIDDGSGIDEKELNHILKKFYRLNQSYKENSLGLGLFIVKYILKLHNIDLRVKSKIAKGSSFGFKIPKHLIN
ncbi:hypothetical protein CCY99_08245 [Helicobacter sp. 16-1353]|uniref:sensor histidine kinase n=1 Tax=Helicobacter sp. 16-1353 TaxID=2004996 RepID=UPI000DCE3F27|nr:HAMP domain-containing sensor histidine kinase [Helicobacter sp. 16-1353]RAX51931.1 hypothetical protein CCY99_08245 [Helicobacter sp. 16-1353]